MAERLIYLDKQPGVRAVGIDKTFWSCFFKCVLAVAGLDEENRPAGCSSSAEVWKLESKESCI